MSKKTIHTVVLLFLAAMVISVVLERIKDAGYDLRDGRKPVSERLKEIRIE